MSNDLITCPGCGVRMDLSPFAARPREVICPRCATRTAVPPAEPEGAHGPSIWNKRDSDGDEQVKRYTERTEDAKAEAVGEAGPDRSFDGPIMSLDGPAMEVEHWRLDLSSQEESPARVVPEEPQHALPESSGQFTFVEMGEKPSEVPPLNRQATQSLGEPIGIGATQAMPPLPTVLPIDAKGDSEPLAFSLLGLLSVLTMFPPLGLALCISGLVTAGDLKRHGMRGSYSGVATAVAIVGIALNAIALAVVIGLVALLFTEPALLSYPWYA